MKEFKPIENQEYITFNGEDVVIIDKIQNMPENGAYYSKYMVVMICTKGKVQLIYDGHPVTVHEDELFLAVPGCILSDYMISPNFDCKVLGIKPSEVTSSEDLRNMVVGSALYIKSHPVARLSEEEKKSIFCYYDLICQRIGEDSLRYHKSEIRTLLNALLLYVVGIMDKGMEVSEKSASVHGEKLVEKFVWMVNEDCGHHRSVEYYAEILNITPKYLSSLVRSSVDRTPTEIITAVTMKEIERRLRYSDDSIKEISNDMDFPNTSFFGKYFKRISGMTPNGYRNKHHK